MSGLFDDIGETLNKIAERIFKFCVVVGGLLLLVGLLIIVFDSDVSFIDLLEVISINEEAFLAKILILSGLCGLLGAFATLPLYALGDIVYYCREIRNNTAELVKKSKENKE